MITIGNIINLAGNVGAYQDKHLIKLQTQKNLADLPCVIAEISESHEYSLPSFPVESLEYRGDTIYRMPMGVSVRAFVEAYNYNTFERVLHKWQYESEDFICLRSLGNKWYKNLKIVSWARDTNSQMVGAAYYTISLQEMILVSSYSTTKVSRGVYSAPKRSGNKVAQETNTSEGSFAWTFRENFNSFLRGA